jgi:hypothetical protein
MTADERDVYYFLQEQYCDERDEYMNKRRKIGEIREFIFRTTPHTEFFLSMGLGATFMPCFKGFAVTINRGQRRTEWRL